MSQIGNYKKELKPYRQSNWYGLDVCISCESRLYNKQKNYNGGICPYCGHDSDGTICDTQKIILKRISRRPWWMFWNNEYEYIGMDDASKKWLE